MAFEIYVELNLVNYVRAMLPLNNKICPFSNFPQRLFLNSFVRDDRSEKSTLAVIDLDIVCLSTASVFEFKSYTCEERIESKCNDYNYAEST